MKQCPLIDLAKHLGRLKHAGRHCRLCWSALQPVLFGGVRCAIPGCKPAGWRCKLWQLALRTMTGCVLNHVTLDSYLRCFALRSVLVWALNRHPFVCDYKITTFRRAAFHNKPIRVDSCRFLSILVDSCRFFCRKKARSHGGKSIQYCSAIHLTTFGGSAPFPSGMPMLMSSCW